MSPQRVFECLTMSRSGIAGTFPRTGLRESVTKIQASLLTPRCAGSQFWEEPVLERVLQLSGTSNTRLWRIHRNSAERASFRYWLQYTRRR